MKRPTPAPVTTQLSEYAADARQAVSGPYDLAGSLSHDLHAIPARRRATAARRGLPVGLPYDHDAGDIRAALEHAHALRDLLPALVKLTEAVTGHLEQLDDHHRLMIDGPTRDELPPDVWS